jgi:hypothetical protein
MFGAAAAEFTAKLRLLARIIAIVTNTKTQIFFIIIHILENRLMLA